MNIKPTIRVHTRLFLLIVVFTWVMALACIFVQNNRETDYKIASMDSRLQMQNARILERLADGGQVDDAFVASLMPASDSLRVSLIDMKGTVIYDSANPKCVGVDHSNRNEVHDAMTSGHGYTKRRTSSANEHEYFYSATRGHDVIVRTALPYNATLIQALKADPVSLYVVLGIAIIMTGLAFVASYRVSRSVRNLRKFARAAEFGDFSGLEKINFSDDELGDISKHIVELYNELKTTSEERDKNLRQAMWEQREKHRIKHQLTNNISHEIKTPVQVIQGCLETLENNADQLTPEMRKDLQDKAYANVQRLAALMNDLSTISRISDAPDKIERNPVNVADIIRQAVDDMQVYPPEKQMRIHLDVPDRLMVNGNASLLSSIFHNLLTNAFNYSGGRDVNIRLLEETSDSYKFLFNDNGVGVDPEKLPHIFERFYRVDKGRSRSMGGTGLGLSIVKNGVKFHDGTIEVHNREEGGLEFTFTLHK